MRTAGRRLLRGAGGALLVHHTTIMKLTCKRCSKKDECIKELLAKRPALCEKRGELNETELKILAYIEDNGPTHYLVICEALGITRQQYMKAVQYCKAIGLLIPGHNWKYHTLQQEPKRYQISLWRKRFREWRFHRRRKKCKY